MIKKFHTENDSRTQPTPSELDESSTQDQSTAKVKRFCDVPPTKDMGTVQKNDEAKESISKRSPSVIFSNRVKSIQSDVLSATDDFQRQVDEICARDFIELTLKNKDYLLVQNVYSQINFSDAAYQIEYGNDISKGFQTIQGHLSDYAKIGKVDRILELGTVIIDLAKSIDINIFNPNKIGTKISNMFGSRHQKTTKIKHDFDHASDLIDARVNRVFDNLSEARKLLRDFDAWSNQLRSLHQDLQINLIALKLRINDVEVGSSQEHVDMNGLPDSFQSNNGVFLERWHRKVNTLLALNQSILLTFPQIDLYRSNLLSSFERLEEIKVNVIQVWKQQFLTVIAVDESNDAIMYYELSDIQNQLVRNIQELK
ncbi:toxic anion resistance protein [Enterovibrio makurazakiensis]|uniref:toxic anion resistance protein n=1 Tax=Enterovibrio makurazakiensis TaxID=2910232 RepID=UPI003D1F58CE